MVLRTFSAFFWSGLLSQGATLGFPVLPRWGYDYLYTFSNYTCCWPKVVVAH